MAIKAEYPDELGFSMFDEWSQTAGDQYDQRATRDAWKSIKPGGGIGLGSLFFMAKQHGFEMPKPDQAAPRLSPEAEAERQREQAEAREREAQAERERHEAAAIEARQQWKAAKPDGTSPYLRACGTCWARCLLVLAPRPRPCC